MKLCADDIAPIWIIALIVAPVLAWITHIGWVITKLAGDAGVTAGQIALGIIGTLMPPVGIIHGFMIWFGAGF